MEIAVKLVGGGSVIKGATPFSFKTPDLDSDQSFEPIFIF